MRAGNQGNRRGVNRMEQIVIRKLDKIETTSSSSAGNGG
jgi:hypothetical protein